jgi:hypothetical protein
MTEADEAIPQSVRAALLGSGFPFQTAVRDVVASTPGWKVHASEFAWVDSRGEGRFLDFIASNDTLFLAIECKKMKKESLTFLCPQEYLESGERDRFRCLHGKQVLDALRLYVPTCEESALFPRTVESEFCVIDKNGGKETRLLETDASAVVQATDAFVDDFRRRFNRTFKESGIPSDRQSVFVPTIVTNASIYVTRYQPSEVSLGTAEFLKPPKDIRRVPCLRFRKSFTSESVLDLGERSVFVVSAVAFHTLLGQLMLAPHQPAQTNRVYFYKGPRRQD